MIEFFKMLANLLMPEELPENIEFLKIFIYIAGFIIIIEIILLPAYMIVQFYKNRRFRG